MKWSFQDPIYGGTLVPYFWPYELWGYSLKHRPETYAKNIWNRYIQFFSVPESWPLKWWNGCIWKLGIAPMIIHWIWVSCLSYFQTNIDKPKSWQLIPTELLHFHRNTFYSRIEFRANLKHPAKNTTTLWRIQVPSEGILGVSFASRIFHIIRLSHVLSFRLDCYNNSPSWNRVIFGWLPKNYPIWYEPSFQWGQVVIIYAYVCCNFVTLHRVMINLRRYPLVN